MTPASTRPGRIALAFWTALAAYLLSPASGALPVGRAAAESEGLGAGGASLAYNYVLVVAIVLAFIFGFAIRDVIHRRSLRAKAAKRPAPAAPRT